MERITIFDTTLRDGEQSPGFSMNLHEKLRVAKQLERLNVDVIEAGFPVASPGDFEAVKLIANTVKKTEVAALARANQKDIDTAWEAIKGANNPRIHLFISTSDLHLRYQLKKTREEVLEMARESVRYTKGYLSDIEFSAMDATRSDREFLCTVIEEAIRSGATTVNIPDTVGYTVPAEFSELIGYIKKRVSNIDRATISVHCHNDLGLAVANSLAALTSGARQVECTINGIGERAGNTSLEEIVMILKTRGNILNLKTGIDTQQIYPTSRLISHITGIPVQPNKAIVGANAFAHESGIHQDGLLKEKITYEIITPQSIGIPQSTLVLGKHSGRHAFRDRLKSLGYELSQENLDIAFTKFKELSDKKKEIFDEDIDAIVAEEILRLPDKYKLIYLNVTSGSSIMPTAIVQMELNGKLAQETGVGDGPVDAVFKTISRITGTKSKLLRFSVNSITGGTDAQGEVLVRLEEDETTVIGQGAHTDIIMASAKAYINALNRLEYRKNSSSIKAREP